MASKWTVWSVGLGTALAVACAGTAWGSIDKCQKAVAKESGKLQSKMVKTLNKCADGYQKAVAKGDPISSITAKCNDALGKVFDITNAKSAIGKAKTKLNDTVVKGKCDDEDLSGLGHLRESVWGDKWQRLVIIGAWKTAYEDAVSANAELVNIFEEMVAAGGCPRCSLVNGPPCHTHTCILGPGSGGPVKIATGAPGGFVLATVNLAGATPMSTCDVPSIFPTGEYALVGGASKGILPVLNLLANVHVCVTTFRSEGYINCIGAAGNPRIDTDICVDHLVQDVGGIWADECETLAPTEGCQPRVADTDHTLAPNEVNGGACLNITTNPAVAGDAYFLATTRIQVVSHPAETGLDGQPCTADDTPATITAVSTTPQTTGQATSRVIDPNAIDAWPDITVGPISGTPFTCANLFSSNTSGGVTVSAAAALHGLPGPLDSAFSTTLVCQ